MSSTRIISALMILTGGLLGILYWGIIAWGNPAKFKETSFFSLISNDKRFTIYLWIIRILALVVGLILLGSIAALILQLAGSMQ